jgi:formylglycine-generating enzyme required for sulfatase activity
MDFKRIDVSKLQKNIDPRKTRTAPPPPYKMGSPADEPGREESEPLHTVWFERDFALKTTEVTWAEWNTALKSAEDYEFTDISPGCNGQGGGEDDRHPVLGITWWDAIKWCNLASRIHGKTPVYFTHPSFNPNFLLKSGTPSEIHVNWAANGYRLPTEAEWEFACRPGSSKRAFHTGSIKEIDVKPVDRFLNMAGWYAGNSGGGTHPAGGKEPNSLGLYDMHGNAAEWCWDRAGPLGPADAFDPRGAEHGEARIIRGGSWLDPARHCRAAARGSRNASALPNPSVGFRPAITLPAPDR